MIMMEKKNLKPKNTEKFDLILIWPIFFNIFFFFLCQTKLLSNFLKFMLYIYIYICICEICCLF
ncbi:hypothetical protein RhiirA1_141949 [Rhizophagus irregularis]|uniref:Uncharacterized protein n=1 Tax=Rhizophagus irregularis TaxID=588596 RepID=A0A2N0QU04_9GLOM|nr:hypothetical protein RhiirA1_141949 [Rhizophagus irregularis]